jgi:N-ethylmaleimide reductase
MFLQLWHTGRANFVWQAGDDLPVSPSGVPLNSSPAKSRALQIEEIPAIVDAYAKGAENAIAAGFDGVELHGANGYLLDQFTRDGTNIRTDAYGGSIENRLRFPLEVTRKVIAAVGAERTGYRISPSSTFNEMRDSTPRETFGALAGALSDLGLAYLHVVEQNAKDIKHGGEDDVAASYFRQTFKQTIIANGGYDLARGDAALARGDADAIAFGTAFLANPDLPERFRRREKLNDPVPATFYTGAERGYTDYPALASAR